MRAFSLLFFTAAAIYAQPVEELILRGDGFDAKNQNQEALVVFLEADKLKPNDAEILRRVAKQYDQLGVAASSKTEKIKLCQQSLDNALRAVKVGPQNAKAHLCLAIVYGRQAQFEGARRKVEISRLIKQEAETAARLDPREDYAWHVLGRWNYELANFNPVLKALAQTIYGKFPDASNEKAVEHFQKAIALQPLRVLHHVELGRTYLALGEKEKSRQSLQKGLGLASTTPDDEEAKSRARLALQQLK